jgi:alpha-glucoside transport system substrate-binding protein
VLDPSTYIPADWLSQQYNQSWLDMATMEGQSAGVWHRYNGKSLVWYPKDDFDAAGYQVPQTWDELVALTEQIAADGDAPWCIGIESQAATGWPATDWTEDLMLRTTSLENYDAWVAGELPFSSPEVKNAIETWSEIWLNPDYVLGGTDGIVSTYFGDAPAPMFEDPPQCWLHRQGNFITGFFPEGSEAGVDYDFFYLPPVDEAYGRPFLVAGDIMAQFTDRPEVNALMEYFTVPESASVWLGNGGALAAHQTTPIDMYAESLRGIAELAANATSFRFDASDLMPGAVGSGSFWTGITDYVSGLSDLDTALSEIDASWPAGETGAEGPSEPAPEGVFAAPAGGFLERALAGEFAGTTVTVDGTQTEPDDLLMAEGWAAFEEATGITVNYIGDKEFEARISVAIDAGAPPDIADFPQPALLGRFAEQGHVIDVNSFIPADWLTQQYNQSWLDMATMPGADGDISAGVFNRYFVKSLVWYPKDDFDAAGYQVPQTWDELLALTEQIAADGDAPWCIGIESQAATGWPATDWTEDIMLRTTSLENYDAWVAGELPFSSPEVMNAIETWSEIWLNPDYVLGGTDGIVSTFFGDSPAPMFEDPPQCWLHRQANFITSFFPEDAEAGVDYDFFYLPPIDDAYGKPFLVAGDIYALFTDTPQAKALMEYFTLPESVSGFLQNGGAFAAQQTATEDMYAVPLEYAISEVLNAEATSVRFDGSDLMPAAVGAGSFWTGITDYVSGLSDLETAMGEIDASWPPE